MKSFKQYITETFVSWEELGRLERVLDSMFAQVGLDIGFTKHFWERINGSRSYGGTVSIIDIKDAFQKTFQRYAKQIAAKPVDWKAVINDVTKGLNMPFTLAWDRMGKRMVMLTAMRKSDFKTPDPKLKV